VVPTCLSNFGKIEMIHIFFKGPSQDCSYASNFLLNTRVRCHPQIQWYLMPVAQSLGGKFTEEEAIIPGHAAEMPDTELGGNFGDCYR
jgi:hypothetical protein